MCLPMLVLVIDMNLLVITTNSSMSQLDCSLVVSLSHRRQFPRSAFSRDHFSASDVTSRMRDLRYNRASTWSRSNSVPRPSVPLWNTTTCAVNKRASSYLRISTHFENGHDSLPQSVMSFDAMQVFRDLIAFRWKSNYRTIVTIKLCTIANKVSIKNLTIC